MPVYEYECQKCRERFEVTQKFSDPAITVCRICNAEDVRKILSPTAFVLKGSGWYATDYASGSRKTDDSEKPCKEDSKPAAPDCAKGGCPSGGCASKAGA